MALRGWPGLALTPHVTGPPPTPAVSSGATVALALNRAYSGNSPHLALGLHGLNHNLRLHSQSVGSPVRGRTRLLTSLWCSAGQTHLSCSPLPTECPACGGLPQHTLRRCSVLGEGRKGVTGQEKALKGDTGPHRSNQPAPVLTELNGDLKIPRMVLFLTKECSAREKMKKKKKKRHRAYHICLKGNKIEACFSRPHLRAKVPRTASPWGVKLKGGKGLGWGRQRGMVSGNP